MPSHDYPGPLPSSQHDPDATTLPLRAVRASSEEHEMYLSVVLRHPDKLVLAEVFAAFTSWLVEQVATQAVSFHHAHASPASIRTVPTDTQEGAA